MFALGSEGLYEWLVTDRQFDLLETCPDLVLGKYVAITSSDSGQLMPGKKETAAGWHSRDGISYSPKVLSIDDVPRDGWGEWYIFDSPPDLGVSHLGKNIFETPQEPGHLNVFVNYRFALHLANMKELADMFWRQMGWIQPETYVADNDYLTLVSRNKDLFAKTRDLLRALPND
jgi:hypothetical protein